MRAVPSISRIAWISDWRAPTRSSRCPVRNSQSLHLFGVFLHGQCVHRTDGLEGFGDPRRFRLQGLEVEVEHRRAFQQLIEGPVPLGFDPLHDAAATAGRLGEPYLECVALLVRGFQRAARLHDFLLGGGERPLRVRQGRFRVGGRVLQLMQRHLALRAGFAPFRLLLHRARLHPARAAPARRRARGPPPRPRSASASARSSRSSAERRPPATWASCTCQCTRCSRAASCSVSSSASRLAGRAEVFVQPVARQLALDQRVVDLPQPLLGALEPLGEPRRAGTRNRPTRESGWPPGGCRVLRVATAWRSASRAARPRRRSRSAAAPAGPGVDRLPQRRFGGGNGGPGPLHLLTQVRQLGAAPERARRRAGAARGRWLRWRGEGRGPTGRVPREPARAARTQPAAGPSTAEPVIDRAAAGWQPGPGSSGSSTRAPGCCSACQACTASHRRLVAHQHRVHPVAQQPLGQLARPRGRW